MMEAWFAGIGLTLVAGVSVLVLVGFGLIIYAIVTEDG